MFNAEKIAALESEVKDLRERLQRVEAATTPLPTEYEAANYLHYSYYYTPTVSIRDAVSLLAAHLGVKFKNVPGTPARTDIAKVRK